MSLQEKEVLKATIYNLGGTGDSDLFATLAKLTDAELEQILTNLLKE